MRGIPGGGAADAKARVVSFLATRACRGRVRERDGPERQSSAPQHSWGPAKEFGACPVGRATGPEDTCVQVPPPSSLAPSLL